MNLLCRVGLHHPTWQPEHASPIANPHGTQVSGWIKLCTCTRCGLPIGHRTR